MKEENARLKKMLAEGKIDPAALTGSNDKAEGMNKSDKSPCINFIY